MKMKKIKINFRYVYMGYIHVYDYPVRTCRNIKIVNLWNKKFINLTGKHDRFKKVRLTIEEI